MAFAHRYSLVFLALAILACSCLCSCHKKPASQSPILADGKELPIDSLYRLLSPSYLHWQDAYIPMQISMLDPSNIQISGRTTMLRDSLIHISLRMLGMEVGAALVTQDSIFAADKYHKLYIAESLSDILSTSSISIGQLQDLLLGQIFDIDNPMPGITIWGETSLDNPAYLLSLHLLANNIQTSIAYPTHSISDAGIVADYWDLQSISPSQKWQMQWKWQLSNAKWNTARQVNFKIGNDYKRIHREALIQILKSL